MKKLLIIFAIFAVRFLTFSRVNARSRKFSGGGGVAATGTFREAAAGGQFKILALCKRKLRVAFSDVYPYKTASGDLKVAQSGTDIECASGADVSAAGYYRKISGGRMKF